MSNLPFEEIKRDILVRNLVKTDPKYGISPEKRTTEELLNYGVINVDKPPGPTSHQVSAYVQQALKIKKSGHSGTLDPKVTGVLPTAIGRATKVVQALLHAGKEYIGIMHLHASVDLETINKTLEKFKGKIKQLPPIKSSVKRQWRFRNVYYFDVIEISDDNKDILFRLGCEAGTYVRKLCLHPKTDIMTTEGFMSASDFYLNHPNIYSFKEGKMIEKNSTATQKIKSPSKLLKINMSSGVNVIVTSDHELLSSKDLGYKMIEAKDLKKGDFLVKSLKFPQVSPEFIISDLLDDDYYIQQKEIKEKCKQALISKYGSIRAMYRHLKLDRKSFLFGSNHAITINHLKKAGIYNNVKKNIHTFKTQKGNVIKMKKFNQDFFYLLGLIASDGNNTKEKKTARYTKVKFHNQNEGLINQFLKIYKNIFPNVPISKKEIKTKFWQLDTTNSFFATVAASLGIRSPQKNSDLLPILNANPKLIKAFLKGYFDGDGSAYYKKTPTNHKTKICLHTISYICATRLHKMLLKIGIPNKIFTRKRLTSNFLKRKHNFYEVAIGNIIAEKKFIKEVGTNHNRKAEKFKKIFNLKYEDTIDNNYYIAFHFKDQIRKHKSKLHKMGGNLNRVLTTKIPITKGFYEKASKIVKLPDLDDFIIEKISSVEIVNGNDYVYDMTVPETHNFLIESGFVSSNCHDFGQEIKDKDGKPIGAHMAELRRTKAGPFNEINLPHSDESTELCTLQDLADAFHYYKTEGNDKFLRKLIQPVENAVRHLPKIWVMDTTVNTLCHGAQLKVPGISKIETKINPEDIVAIMTLKDELVAFGIAKMNSKEMLNKERGIAVKIERVFMEPGTYPKIERV
ncbi:MAG: PUA domain-containing protein [Candidatus Woesearchaeota archaeon]